MKKIERGNIFFQKTTNHVYETCTEFAAIGARSNEGKYITLELCRDIIEIKQGQINEESDAQVTRLNFATISLDFDTTKRLIKRLQSTIEQMESPPQQINDSSTD